MEHIAANRDFANSKGIHALAGQLEGQEQESFCREYFGAMALAASERAKADVIDVCRTPPFGADFVTFTAHIRAVNAPTAKLQYFRG